MRYFIFALIVFSGCVGSNAPYDSSQEPVIEVHHLIATDPPVISWEPSDAMWVEVRLKSNGRVVWRVEESRSPHGVTQIYSPLTYGSYSDRTINPPDNAIPRTTFGPEPLAPGVNYTVTVHRRDQAFSEIAPRDTQPRRTEYEATVEFTTSDTIPMD